MNEQIANLWKHPKSTIKAALGLAIAVTIALLALPPKASIGVVVLAVLRACLGFAQQDVGRVEAVTPSGATEMVASHETPDNPVDVPVTKEQ